MGGDAEDGWFPDLEQWEIEETLTQNGKLGWLVEFATPVPRDFYESGDSRGYSFSWGHYRLTWFYGETFEACCQQAITWQAEFIKACREKAEQEAAA